MAAAHPSAKTGAHHHGAVASIIDVVKSQARIRWGEHLEFTEPVVVNLDIAPAEALETVHWVDDLNHRPR